MGTDVQKYKNKITSKLNSFVPSSSNSSRTVLEDEIDFLFLSDDLEKIQGHDELSDYYNLEKNRIINEIYFNKRINTINENHDKKVKLMENNARKQAEELKRNLQDENEKKINLLNKQHNKTVERLEKNTLQLEKNFKMEQKRQEEENEKKINLLNKQHNETVKRLEKNSLEQAENFRIEQNRQREENEKKINLLNRQHNETIQRLEQNSLKQAENFKMEQKRQREENDKKINLLNKQHNETIQRLEQNSLEQAENFKKEQKRQKEENEKNIALLKEQHEQTIIHLEKNSLEQAENFKIEQKRLKEENEKNIALLKEQHNKTIEMLKQKMLEQEERQKKREQEYLEENQRKEKEANARIASLIEQHNNNITSLEKKAREQVEMFNEQQQLREIEFKKTIEDMEKKYKEERDEEKKKQILLEQQKLQELNEKKIKIRDEFENHVKDILKNRIEEIIISFNLNADKFCLEDISKFDINKIKILLQNLLKFENSGTYIKKQLFSILEGIKPKNVEHLNIVLVGPSGVGKSTLINAILELETKTETGFGGPKTQKIEFFSSNKIPFLRLADSKGIEKNIDSGTDATYKSIKEFINKQIETGDPDNYIHCIWYCWTGSRLEKSEQEILLKLSEQYTLDTLPVISVYTNAINKTHIIKAKEYIHDELKLKNEFIEVLSVEVDIDLGDKIIIKPSFGLDKLKETSIKLAKSAINSACYEGLIKDVEKNINTKISNINEILNVKINSLVKEIISLMNEESKLEDFYKKYIIIILNIFYKYLYIDPEINVEDTEKPEIKFEETKLKISEEIIILIKDFINDYFNECMKSLDSNINQILKEQSEKISKEIYSYQLEYNVNHENLLDIKTNLEMQSIIKVEIYDKIYKKAKLTAFKNCFSFLIKPFIENVGTFFNTLFKKGMDRKDFKEKIDEIIKIPFNIIEEKIKEYEERKKKEEEERRKKEEERRKKEEERRKKEEEESRKKEEEEERKKKEEEQKPKEKDNEKNNVEEAPTPINIDTFCDDLLDD